MTLSQRTRSILSWVLTIGGGIALGAIAARFRLLDHTAVLLGLVVVMAAMIGLGIWAMAQPWHDD